MVKADHDFSTQHHRFRGGRSTQLSPSYSNRAGKHMVHHRRTSSPFGSAYALFQGKVGGGQFSIRFWDSFLSNTVSRCITIVSRCITIHPPLRYMYHIVSRMYHHRIILDDGRGFMILCITNVSRCITSVCIRVDSHRTNHARRDTHMIQVSPCPLCINLHHDP